MGVFTKNPAFGMGPPQQIVEWVTVMRDRSIIFRDKLPEGFSIERDWGYIETMSREDIAVNLPDITPVDADLARMVVYETSGTTGHAIAVPQHPLAMAKNHPLLELALASHGVTPVFGSDMVSCFNVGSEAVTVVFPNVFSVWGQAGFAKINIHEKAWNSREDAAKFFKNHSPHFLTGDPIGLSEMMKWEIETEPSAMISTAVTMPEGLKKRLEARYRCPVIDFYSTTETGPDSFHRSGR